VIFTIKINSRRICSQKLKNQASFYNYLLENNIKLYIKYLKILFINLNYWVEIVFYITYKKTNTETKVVVNLSYIVTRCYIYIYSRLHYGLSLESSQMIRNYIFKSLKLRKNVLNLLILHLLIMPSNLPTSTNYPSDLQLPTNLNLDQED
jgi:hypothetical protein